MTNDFKEFIIQNYPPSTIKINASVNYQLKIGPEGAKLLAETITWPIEHLNLNIYFIENQGMQAIIKSGTNWPTLTEILLEKNNISCEGLMGISQANWKKLRKINLTKNNIRSKGFAEIVKADWPELISLELSHSEIGETGAMKLPFSNWPKLQILNLNYNLIGNEGLRQLAKCNLRQLRSLQLSNNKLYGKSMIYLASIDLPNLKDLTLNRNLIGRDSLTLSEIGCIYLSRIKADKLKSLRLFGNDITLNGIKEVMYSGKLAENCFLEIMRNHFYFEQIEEDIKICKVFSNQF